MVGGQAENEFEYYAFYLRPDLLEKQHKHQWSISSSGQERPTGTEHSTRSVRCYRRFNICTRAWRRFPKYLDRIPKWNFGSQSLLARKVAAIWRWLQRCTDTFFRIWFELDERKHPKHPWLCEVSSCRDNGLPCNCKEKFRCEFNTLELLRRPSLIFYRFRWFLLHIAWAGLSLRNHT